MLESWFVGLVLGPSQHDLANGIATTDQIVVTHLQITIRWTTGKIEPYRNVESHFLHIHLVDDEHEGLVPVRVQVAALTPARYQALSKKHVTSKGVGERASERTILSMFFMASARDQLE